MTIEQLRAGELLTYELSDLQQEFETIYGRIEQIGSRLEHVPEFLEELKESATLSLIEWAMERSFILNKKFAAL